MVETSKRKPKLPEGIEIRDANMGKIIGNIPNDTGSPFAFSLMIGSGIRLGDAVIDLSDTTFETGIYLEPIIFRSGFGGGALPCIAEELSVLFRAFENHGGKIPSWYKRKNHQDDRFPNYIVATVEESKNPEDSQYIIRNLQDDDEQIDELRKFLDIEITREGDVIVTQRFLRSDFGTDGCIEVQGQMVLKTAKNGGKFSIMAEVFTRIAERIAKSQARKK